MNFCNKALFWTSPFYHCDSRPVQNPNQINTCRSVVLIITLSFRNYFQAWEIALWAQCNLFALTLPLLCTFMETHPNYIYNQGKSTITDKIIFCMQNFTKSMAKFTKKPHDTKLQHCALAIYYCSRSVKPERFSLKCYLSFPKLINTRAWIIRQLLLATSCVIWHPSGRQMCLWMILYELLLK